MGSIKEYLCAEIRIDCDISNWTKGNLHLFSDIFKVALGMHVIIVFNNNEMSSDL